MKDKVISIFSHYKKVLLLIVCIIILLLIVFYFYNDDDDGPNLIHVSEEDKVLIELKDDIEDYLKNYGRSFSRTNQSYEFKKCPKGKDKCDKSKMKEIGVRFIGTYLDDEEKLVYEIRVDNLVSALYIDDQTFVNPTNEKRCFSIIGEHVVDPIIMAYVDDDDEYYYYVDLTGKNTDCEFTSKRAFITNFPDELVKALKKAKVDLPKQFDDE